MTSPQLQLSIETPSPISCMAVRDSSVVLGCEDGTVRRYTMPENKVRKALMGLGTNVSWIQFSSIKGKKEHVWLAAGMALSEFNFSVNEAETSPIGSILRPQNAISRIAIDPETEDDEINEINLKKDLLAFTTDSGRVGVVDLPTKSVSFMRQIHRNIAFPITFIPSRPYEICSGGYDSTLLHFDARNGSLLSHLDLTPPNPSDESNPSISLSPPFALSLATSSDDVIACSTATGHIWLGHGGSRSAASNSGKRKSRKWNGLKAAEGTWIKAGNGPIVAVSFNPIDEAQILTLSLHGNLSCFDIASSGELWSLPSKRLVKATTLVASDHGILTCGVSSNQKGIMEMWKLPSAGPIEGSSAHTNV